jgi:hypothetical protein
MLSSSHSFSVFIFPFGNVRGKECYFIEKKISPKNKKKIGS